MSTIKENFEMKMKEMQIPVNYQEIEQGHHLYRFSYQVTKSKQLLVEVILQESEEKHIDTQVIYRHVHQMDDRQKEPQALELINELNGMQTGYYTLYLAGDGEIFLRSLVRVGQNIEPLYETIIMGSAIARTVIPRFTEILGNKE